ncbi:hypothetical protein ACFPVT_04005 [Corynebacterium choanae]|uniref:hypothetical protein n=1 Tax=Corynebacterium choanae TaxID=1862358 RepID=UPI0013DE0A1D|nr:hypothetical protein [Corynebacterium choanae]
MHSVMLAVGLAVVPAGELDRVSSRTSPQTEWYFDDPMTPAAEEQFLTLMHARLEAAESTDVAVLLTLAGRTVATAQTWTDSSELPLPEDLSSVPGVDALATATATQLRAATTLAEVTTIYQATRSRLDELVAQYWRDHGREDVADTFAHPATPQDHYRATALPSAAAAGPGTAPWWFALDFAVVVACALLWSRRQRRGPVESLLLNLAPTTTR